MGRIPYIVLGLGVLLGAGATVVIQQASSPTILPSYLGSESMVNGMQTTARAEATSTPARMPRCDEQQ
jgi:hypothetical protein